MPFIFAFSALILSTATFSAAQTSTRGIQFQPCPELNANITVFNGVNGTTFDCAQLLVPLDYTDPNSAPLNLSLFRVSATAEPVLGTVLINFGGPGGTGAENLPFFASQAHSNIGPQWNLVSWDPRGTGYTIPFNCGVGESGTGATITGKRDVGNLVSANITKVFLNGGWEIAGQTADFCFTKVGENGTLIGTAFVARDMFEIVDALGEDGLLRFYGWSYGTALGSYAAAMFPERIGAIVLDGNLNPHNYQAGHYLNFADDIDEGFEGFLQTCFDVTDDCALYSFLQPNTTQDLLDAINMALTPLLQSATTNIEGYSAYAAVKNILIQPLYYPTSWPQFAETLISILNATADSEAPAADTPRSAYGAAANAVLGIRASDAIFIANSSDEYLPIVQASADVSPGFSDVSYFPLWLSARWRLPAKERYWGDFRVNTSAPILYVNGEFDPVTPLQDAYNGSATFAGSVVLPHSGYGHGIFVNPSQCVARYVQAYFSSGTLPEEGAHCEPDLSPVEMWRANLKDKDRNSTAGNDIIEVVPGGAGRGSVGIAFVFVAVLASAFMNMM